MVTLKLADEQINFTINQIFYYRLQVFKLDVD